MPERHPLQSIKTFPSLVKYLRDELDWPIDTEDFGDLTFEYPADELGLDAKLAAKVRDIKQLRRLANSQPWGIFFLDFEPKQIPVVALRKILANLVLRKRESANASERPAWQLHDLLFISRFGEGDERQLTLAHFSEGAGKKDIPTLKVLGWDEFDTQLKIQHVERELRDKLRWPTDEANVEHWRKQWSSAFTLRRNEVINTAKDLAVRLADLAKAIRQRVKLVLEIETDRGPLRKLYVAFREALIHDLDEDDFADMFAQTITYGLFSTAVSGTVPGNDMVRDTYVDTERLVESVPVTNPFLKEMLSTFLTIGGRKGKLDFDELGIQDVVEVLNSKGTNLNAVLRDFGKYRQKEDPVIHFYEDFLKQYDKKRKVERGVFYTPQPVVSYIVRSVHELLQTEFGLEDGLASTITWSEMAKYCGAGFQPAPKNSMPAGNMPEGNREHAGQIPDSQGDCGAAFQAANPKKEAGKMPAPQKIIESTDPPLTAGSCVLRQPEIAEIVQNALLHFEGERYHLAAWCVMPNHVHVVVQPLPGYKLEDILHSWKSFTATKINRQLGRKGAFWERESFDHLIRTPEYREQFVYYTEHNPVAAGLVKSPQDWPFSSCGAGFQPAKSDFIDPRSTPFVEPRSRGELPHLHKEGGTYFITWRLLDAVVLNCGAGFQPAPGTKVARNMPPSPDETAGKMPPSPDETAGKMPAPQFAIPEGTDPNSPFVTILDPATGTATFLVEVIEVIHNHLRAKFDKSGLAALPPIINHKSSITTFPTYWNAYVPQHLLPRLHGYELMMAPYAIAHMKIGLKLTETGYLFRSDERARIYLTNALETSKPAIEQKKIEELSEALAHEAKAVNNVKRKQRFTIVIGNPPYSRASSNKGSYIEDLVSVYKRAVRDERNIQPLSDDYIKFIRLSEVTLNQAGTGVFGMVTNNTFLSGRIHRGMRGCLAESFSLCRLVNLHGSGKVDFLGIERRSDENVFDILQGVAISILAKSPRSSGNYYLDLVGERERKYSVLSTGNIEGFAQLEPQLPYLLWIPRSQSGMAEYSCFLSLDGLFDFYSVSGKPGDDALLISFSRDDVLPKLREFRRSLSKTSPSKLTEAGRNLAAREATKPFRTERIIPYAYRPFDTRFTYYDPKVWTRAVEPLKQCVDGSPILLTTKIVKDSQFAHAFVSRLFADVIFLSNTSSVNCYSFPATIPTERMRLGLRGNAGIENFDTSQVSEHLGETASYTESLNYTYAVLYSPNYRNEYIELLQYDFPRIPLPSSIELFRNLAQLGGELVALHLLESPKVEKPITKFIGPASPEVDRVGWSDDTVWIDAPPAKKGQPQEPGATGFRGVPEAVWNFHIGGYQVCRKWLKDRKGRTLSPDDIAHYQKIVVALSETIRLMAEIDEVIETHGGWPGAFATASSSSTDRSDS